MVKWLILVVIVVIAVVLGLNFYNPNNNVPVTTTTTQPVTTPEGANTVVDANNQFTLDLYSKYKSKDENIFFSPYSISSALAMTYEGAKGQTAEEIQKVFYFPNDKDKMRSGFADINNQLNRGNKSYNLTVANALWAQKDYPFNSDYLDTVERYYGGKATNLDFMADTENSRQIINSWVENKTNDRIKDIIPEGAITHLTRLVLTNAIYFKANWSEQFDDKSTNDQQFTLSSGMNVMAKMMHRTGYYNYTETDDLQILEMPYLGDDISMIIILPKGNSLSQLESSFSLDNLAKWKKDMEFTRLEVSLPKFKFETKYLMAIDLKEMGMPTPFSENDADFKGMTQYEQLYISAVIHQTFVEVSESGTEAAAATVVIMGTIGPQPEQPKIFTADHPFIFLIQQKETGNILFLGRLSDPSK